MPVWPGIQSEAQKTIVDFITAKHFLDWGFDVIKLQVCAPKAQRIVAADDLVLVCYVNSYVPDCVLLFLLEDIGKGENFSVFNTRSCRAGDDGLT